MIRLYRAVSPAELADINATNAFRPGSNSLERKWFAESADDARHWGQLLYPIAGDLFHVVSVDAQMNVADQMFRLDVLDQIGPARYAADELLTLLNQQHTGIAEVP